MEWCYAEIENLDDFKTYTLTDTGVDILGVDILGVDILRLTHFDKTWMNGQFRPHMWNYYTHNGPQTTITWKEAQQKEENCKKGTPNSV